MHTRTRNVLIFQNLGFSLIKKEARQFYSGSVAVSLSAVSEHGNSTEKKCLLSKLRNVAPAMMVLVTNSYPLWVQSSEYTGVSVS